MFLIAVREMEKNFTVTVSDVILSYNCMFVFVNILPLKSNSNMFCFSELEWVHTFSLGFLNSPEGHNMQFIEISCKVK